MWRNPSYSGNPVFMPAQQQALHFLLYRLLIEIHLYFCMDRLSCWVILNTVLTLVHKCNTSNCCMNSLSFDILNLFWQYDTSPHLFVYLCFSCFLSQSIHLLLLFNPRPTSYTCVTLKCRLCIIICGWRVWVTLPLLSTQTTEVPLSKTLNTQRASVKLNSGVKLQQICLSQIYFDCLSSARVVVHYYHSKGSVHLFFVYLFYVARPTYSQHMTIFY